MCFPIGQEKSQRFANPTVQGSQAQFLPTAVQLLAAPMCFPIGQEKSQRFANPIAQAPQE